MRAPRSVSGTNIDSLNTSAGLEDQTLQDVMGFPESWKIEGRRTRDMRERANEYAVTAHGMLYEAFSRCFRFHSDDLFKELRHICLVLALSPPGCNSEQNMLRLSPTPRRIFDPSARSQPSVIRAL